MAKFLFACLLSCSFASFANDEGGFSENSSIMMKDGTHFELQAEPETDEQRDLFEGLTAEERAEFFRIRNRNLGLLARSLYKKAALIGRVVETKKFSFDWLGKKNISLEMRTRQFELGRETIQKIIREFDTRYWNASAVVVKPSDEKGVMVAAVAGFGAGVLKFGWLKVYELGIGMGYNKTTGRFYLETFLFDENYEKSYTYAGTGYLGVHVGAVKRVHSEAEKFELIRESGTTTVYPVFSVYTSARGRMYVSGLGAELAMLVPGLQYAELYELSWERKGFRWNFKLPEAVRKRLICEKNLTKG